MSSTPFRAPPRTAVSRNVWAVSVTSLFSDWSYEMLLPILPFFMVYVLDAPIVVVGLVEGVAVFAQAVVQPVSSHFVRTAEHRKRGGLLGYGTTTAAHGALAVASSWPWVFALRTAAWTGRGFRQPIKRTILSNASASSARGAAFGMEQAFDSLGAVLGTTVAILLLLREGLAGSSRDVFAISVIPGLVAVLVFALAVKEPRELEKPPTVTKTGTRAEPLPRSFRWFLLAATLFGLGFFNILLAVLDIGEGVQLSSPLGGGLTETSAIVLALVVYLLYNLVYAGVSLPVGRLSDRQPGVRWVAMSYLLFLPVDVLLIFETGILGAVALMVGAGLQIALLDVVESTWISRAVPEGLTAVAFGWFGGLRGLGSLVGSVVVGAIWEYVSVALAFSISAVLVVAAAVTLLIAVRDPSTSVARGSSGAMPA